MKLCIFLVALVTIMLLSKHVDARGKRCEKDSDCSPQICGRGYYEYAGKDGTTWQRVPRCWDCRTTADCRRLYPRLGAKTGYARCDAENGVCRNCNSDRQCRRPETCRGGFCSVMTLPGGK